MPVVGFLHSTSLDTDDFANVVAETVMAIRFGTASRTQLCSKSNACGPSSQAPHTALSSAMTARLAPIVRKPAARGCGAPLRRCHPDAYGQSCCRLDWQR